MSIKNLFNKKQASFENATSGSSRVESSEFIIKSDEKKQTFIPNINFNSASNFANLVLRTNTIPQPSSEFIMNILTMALKKKKLYLNCLLRIWINGYSTIIIPNQLDTSTSLMAAGALSTVR